MLGERIMLLLKNNTEELPNKLKDSLIASYAAETYYKKCMQIYNEGFNRYSC